MILRDQRRTGSIVSCPLADAVGYHLAAPLLADRPLPPFTRACMDGYALSRRDLADPPAGGFRIVRRQFAGQPDGGPVNAGEAIKISTGAVVPALPDAVVIPHEHTESLGENRIRVVQNPPPDGFLQTIGSDACAGTVLQPAGTLLTPAVIAVAAAVGKDPVLIEKPLSVGVLTTGDEVIPPDQEPAAHQVRGSNGPFLRAVLENGRFPVTLHHANDEPFRIKTLLRELLSTCDVVLTVGGVASGPRDFLPGVLADLGCRTWFQRVAQKPGKPLWCGEDPHGRVIFALPGNPASVALCLARYVLPWLRHGRQGRSFNPSRVFLSHEVTNRLGLTRFFPYEMDENGEGRTVSLNTSGDFLTLARARGWIEVPPESIFPQKTSFSAFPLW